MKKIIYNMMLLLLVTSAASCKKFLVVDPADRLGSNSFWKSKEDVEAAVLNNYGFLFDKINSFDSPVIPVSGDFRCGGIAGSNPTQDLAIGFVAVSRNDLSNKAELQRPDRYHLNDIDDWAPYFQSIANCNITLSELQKVDVLTEDEKKIYEAEVKFVRAFTYFHLCRLYGDVPFYTKAYDKEPRGRTSFVTIFKTLIDELNAVKDNLPWQQPNPSNWGVRACRASIYTVIAHMDMWLAGFDKDNQQKYWKDAAEKAQAVKNSGQFELLPIEEFKKIFKGKTRESIFEFSLDRNYGQTSLYVHIGQWMTHAPIVDYGANSDLYFKKVLVEKIFPQALADKRRDLWFYLPYIDNQTAMFMKFSNVADPTGYWRFEDNLIIFRYSDVLLLGAEALANIGNDAEAIALMNEVRTRAATPLYDPSQGNLKDAIFWERQKELLGEGHRWFDFVRTGRVTDPSQIITSLTQDQFAQGAWTWPIDENARVNNPLITLNQYWVK